MDKVLFHLLNDLDRQEEKENIIKELVYTYNYSKDVLEDLSFDELKELYEKKVSNN